MYERETVFILGAGASRHYGYPTGLDLIEDSIKNASHIAGECLNNISQILAGNYQSSIQRPPEYLRKMCPKCSDTNPQAEWHNTSDLFKDFANKLKQQNPLVIDYFLTDNEESREIGKIVIAWVILTAESNHRKEMSIEWRQSNDWLRIICNKMLSGCMNADEFVAGNKISFVTFNYDVSLEYFLHSRFCNVDKLKLGKEKIMQFLTERIHHVYGSVKKYPGGIEEAMQFPEQAMQPRKFQDVLTDNLEKAYRASLGIEVISGVKQAKKSDKLLASIQKIATAQDVYFLGYGFDHNNNAHLELARGLINTVGVPVGDSFRNYYFTNFGESRKVSKAFARIIGVSPDRMLSSARDTRISVGGQNGTPFMQLTWDISTKKVYGALSEDFD